MTNEQRKIRDAFIKLMQEQAEARLAGNHRLANKLESAKNEVLKKQWK